MQSFKLDPFSKNEYSRAYASLLINLRQFTREYLISLSAYLKSSIGALRASLSQHPKLASDTLQPITFSYFEEPIASIIIPFYNQILATDLCLLSIAKTTTSIPIEVILVDDASPDPNASKFSDIPGCVYHRNACNLGFIGSSNAGASIARGKYLVFLNNDTEVREGWIHALLQTFETFDNVGLVGAKLIYPDGRLQEAGGIVWRDGSGCNFGKFSNPDRPEYNYLRDVDYCSGACIAIPREVFEDLNGFDAIFTPAYYEDTDIAFRIRAMGLRTIYQPLAEVIHYEGLSSGTDLNSGVKKHQVINRTRFLDRWQTQLRHYHLAPGRSSASGTTVSSKPRLLVVDTHFPCPDFDSGSVRMFEMLLAARDAGFDVIFHCLENNFNTSIRRSQLQSRGIQVLYPPWYNNFQQIMAQIGPTLDAILISRPMNFHRLHRMVRRFAPRAKLIYDTVDLHFLRMKREALLHGLDSKNVERYQKIESEAANQADLTFVVSSTEIPILSEVSPAANIQILSNIHSLAKQTAPFQSRDGILFIGGFQHPPNIDAVHYFAKSVFPIVQKSLPNIKFRIVGSWTPEEIKSYHGNDIEILGYVEDIVPILNQSRVMVAPLRYGAGVKGKINTAMSYGIPVVATEVAVEGMGMTHGRDVLVGQTPNELAKEIIRIYQDEILWNQVANEARATLIECFSRDKAIATFKQIIAQ